MQKIEHFNSVEKVYKEKESKIIEHAGNVDPVPTCESGKVPVLTCTLFGFTSSVSGVGASSTCSLPGTIGKWSCSV